MKKASHTASLYSINATRASLCEILASSVLRRIAEEPDIETSDIQVGRDLKLLKLTQALARNFTVFHGAPESVVRGQQEKGLTTNQSATKYKKRGRSKSADKTDKLELLEDGQNASTSALELAILSSAKQFIRGQPCQDVVEGIWTGKIVYTNVASYHILPDNYKRKPIALYDPVSAPILDHYRLQVPRIRAALETCSFVSSLLLLCRSTMHVEFTDINRFLILFLSYFVVLETRVPNQPPNGFEIFFIIYGIGFTLDKFTSTLEHGWKVFASNLWNGLDALFCVNFVAYLVVLSKGKYLQHHNVLSCAAVFLLPRLAFLALSDNLLVLAVRAMLTPFFFLMTLAAWCFGGFLYALWLLSRVGQKEYSVGALAQYMVWIWFGLDATGISISHKIHPILGPVLFFAYACLSNTLLVTILVAILSGTFANIDRDAHAESLFRRTVVIYQGIKCDGIFNYMPPVNTFALIGLLPIRLCTSQRRFHTINVFCTRVLSGPILLLIAVFERRHLKYMPNRWQNITDKTSTFALRKHVFNPRRNLEAVFETPGHSEDDPDSDSSLSKQKQRPSSSAGHHTEMHRPSPGYRTARSRLGTGVGTFRNISMPSHPARPKSPVPPPIPPRKRRESKLATLFSTPSTPQHQHNVRPSPLGLGEGSGAESAGVVQEMRNRLAALEEGQLRVLNLLEKLVKVEVDMPLVDAGVALVQSPRTLGEGSGERDDNKSVKSN